MVYHLAFKKISKLNYIRAVDKNAYERCIYVNLYVSMALWLTEVRLLKRSIP